jgi:DNA-binding NtrC family response regulator
VKDGAALVLFVAPPTADARALNAAIVAAGHQVEGVQDTAAALSLLAEVRVDGLVVALGVRGIDGLAVLERARSLHPDLCAVAIAAAGDETPGLAAMQRGAADWQAWPGSAGKLLAVLERGLEHQARARQVSELEGRLSERHGFEQFTGNGPAIVRLIEQARRVADTPAPLLLRGEAGTGKDRLARALHQNSSRSGRPFVRVAGDDVERGRKEAAAGTLLVHGGEIAAGPLRARLAELATAAAGARLLVALGPGADEDWPGFTTLRLPPLRERGEDLPLLVDRFLREMNREHGRRVTGVTRGALAHLAAHDWPGNVRELRSTLEGMVVFTEGRRPLDVSDLPLSLRQRPAASPGEGTISLSLDMSLAEAEKRFMEETLRSVGYDRPRAAETLGIGLRTLYRKLKEYEIG